MNSTRSTSLNMNSEWVLFSFSSLKFDSNDTVPEVNISLNLFWNKIIQNVF